MTLPRFYPVVDTTACAARGFDPVTVAAELVETGARILQFRHKGHFTRAAFDCARAIADLCRGAGAVYIVDDRADIALVVGAGVHLGQDDLSPADARRLVGRQAVIGFSTHNAGQLQAAAVEPVDYLAIGPMFSTASKDKPDPVLGLDALRELCRFSDRPLVAIGGITRSNANSVLEAGADAVAVISDVLPETNAPGRVRARAREWVSLLGT
jgi:thiamine-phosphate pyrophosphorylase